MGSNTQQSSHVRFPYATLRNISSPQDSANNRKILTGRAPAQSVLDLPTNENLRQYLVEAPGKKRRQLTQVHKAMRQTLEDAPEDFAVKNGGVVIVARGYSVDERLKILELRDSSIINGCQTQGVLKDFIEAKERDEVEIPEVFVSFELIISDDEGLIADTSIARNFQNPVLTVSIMGQKGHLNDLEKSLRDAYPELRLRKTETEWATRLVNVSKLEDVDLGEEYVFTEKLIQVITALTPNDLWLQAGEEQPNKVYTYSAKQKCLKDFQEVYIKAHDQSHADHVPNRELYRFYIDIAPEALELYGRWKTHQGFQGTGLRAIKRDDREIVDVPDGIVFPILAALSVFATKEAAGWCISPPAAFRDEDLIQYAKSSYMGIAASNPTTMGKSKACYTTLYEITSLYQRLLTERG